MKKRRDLDIFPYSYELFTSEKKFYAKHGKEMPFLVNGCPATTHTFDSGHAAVCVDLNHDVTQLQKIGLLIHEAKHVVDHIFECIGESQPSQELGAYMMQRVAQDLIYWAGVSE